MSIRQFLISTIAFAIFPAAILSAADTAEYIGGSVKSIPMNSIGYINTYDAKVLEFTYGTSTYRLPYEQITGTEITKGETHHVVKKIPIPALFGHNKETLTISYKDAAGASGTLSFELSSKLANAAQDAIAEQKAAVQAAAANQSDEWWGDKFWKTTRNQGVWENNSASAAKSAPATATTTKN